MTDLPGNYDDGIAGEVFYSESGITIYNADCGDILPHIGNADIVITDPPYGINFQSNHRIIKYDKIRNDNELPLDLISIAISKATRAAYVFCRWDNLTVMPTPKSVLVWVKNNWSMGGLKHEHGRQWEACCFYAKDDHEFIKRIPDVLYADKTGNRLHPTEKPVALINQLISANIGKLILDPFMGSGTTLVAAKLQGREAIGIEIDRDYCNIAVERLRQEILF